MQVGSTAEPRTARFAEALAAMWPAFDDSSARLGLAVSGGPDSLAMLLLAHRILPGRIAAATINHNLRIANAEEAAMVGRVCAQFGVPHVVLPVQLAEGNVQAEARAARYAALAEWADTEGLAAVATAHHADDQAETLLLRLNRGSGVAGLAGVRSRGVLPGIKIPLLRPLLGVRRAELVEFLSDAGIVAANDPSNTDDRFDRARLRKVLAGTDWIDVAALAASAAHLADADAALDWAAQREWAECVSKAPMGLNYRPLAPRAVALRVIARIVSELGGEEPRGGAVARVFESLLARQPASIGNLVARPTPDGWSFTKAPARRA